MAKTDLRAWLNVGTASSGRAAVSAVALMVGLGVSGAAWAQSEQASGDGEALEAQRTQAELQQRIDAADETVRERIAELRQAEQEAERLAAYNDSLAPQLERLATTLDERRAGMATMSATREALPGVLSEMTERLDRWVEQDIPFLHSERSARVTSLENSLSSPQLSSAEKLERVVAAWQAELAYGRELDAWRGTLEQADSRREVDYLRLGRVGWYYLTPDGHEGGVWQQGEWQPLSAAQRDQVEKGMQIVRDQRAPDLLELPLSQLGEEAN
ncbi:MULTISPECIES: DUF3450 domain-containing protein [Halomonas]|uniref:DUF3450 domain-containing protein n=1 Tax=Halomonas TaxID=2745 RepID=UPI001F5DB6F0|nr:MULTISPECIES: DUF3450 domain-containing protein [Halomonas]